MTVHLGTYLVASSALLLINAIRTPGDLWSVRPIVIWGVLLALHTVVAFLARHSVRLPTPRVSLDPLIPMWQRVQTVIAAWSAPQLSIISRPVLIGEDTPPRPSPAVTEPAPPAESWPAWSPPVTSVSTWPEPPPAPAPAWAASWPAPRPEPPHDEPAVRPTGFDTLLSGTQMASPERPHWEELEVAAATWLASRANDPDYTLSR